MIDQNLEPGRSRVDEQAPTVRAIGLLHTRDSDLDCQGAIAVVSDILVPIVAGLKAGERVVIEGAFMLKGKLKAGSIEAEGEEEEEENKEPAKPGPKNKEEKEKER